MATFPLVWTVPQDQVYTDALRTEGYKKSAAQAFLPTDPQQWAQKRKEILNRLSEAICFEVDHQLPLDSETTGVIYRDGYRVEKVCFQAAPYRYVTACLYIPDGEGPFPAVLNVHGHWINGHLAERVQQRGHILAQSGFVCLSVDAFGSGERAEVHGSFEPHGGPRGILLSNIGESLMGIQIADNMRAVDYLCSLPFVDKTNIGVTGASGGGNQTMYLAAFDERIKAAVSVCSAGSYRSYVMGNNCICETIPGGLDICEESGLIACTAPRAYCMLNGLYDDTSKGTFTPQQMLQTYEAAKKVYEGMGAEENLQYQIFPTGHGYLQDALSYMLGYFCFHLKGESRIYARRLPPIIPLTEEEARVYPAGQRPDKVLGISAYCAIKGKKIREQTEKLSDGEKKEGLKRVLHVADRQIVCCNHGPVENGFEKLLLVKEDGHCIPALLRPSANGNWRILSGAYGKQQLEGLAYTEQALASGDGLLLIDVYGSGETGNEYKNPNYWHYHDISRACLWVGKNMLGEWVMDYTAAKRWLEATYPVKELTLYGYQDAGIAALLGAVLFDAPQKVVVEKAIKSLNWSDTLAGVNTFTQVLCVPDVLRYGDIPDFVRMANCAVEICCPINADGSDA